MSISKQNIKNIFEKAFLQKNDKPFIVFRRSKITYGELKTIIGKTGSFFKKIGVNAGDRVIISSKDESIVCSLYFSCIAHGVTAVFIDPESGAHRSNSIVSHCQPKCIFIDTQLQEKWNLNFQNQGTIVAIQNDGIDKEKQYADAYPACIKRLSESPLVSDIDQESDAYILFTSGTTSEPKGVRISYRALVYRLETLSQVYRMSPHSKMLNNLTLSQTDGMIQGPLLAFYNQATVYRPFAFNIQRIEDMFDIVYQEGITHWAMVPTMIALIYQFKYKDQDRLDQPEFQYVISWGGKLENKLWQEFEEKFRTRIINGYGLAETTTDVLFAGPDDASHIIGTIGVPVRCEAKIVDENGNEQPLNVHGEIWLKGDMLMSGYLNAPEANQEIFSGEWLRTGDIGYKGEDGCFRIVGRKKNIIISGGTNICPEEITEVLQAHPAVQEAAAFGIEDAIWEEIVGCAVVIKSGFIISKEEIIEFCRRHLEEKKVPSIIFMVAELPHNRAGKVVIRELKDKLSNIEHVNKTNGNLETVFTEIVSRSLQIALENINLDLRAEDTSAWDSLSHLSLIVELEKHFHIEFTPLEVINARSLRDLYNTVKNKLSK